MATLDSKLRAAREARLDEARARVAELMRDPEVAAELHDAGERDRELVEADELLVQARRGDFAQQAYEEKYGSREEPIR